MFQTVHSFLAPTCNFHFGPCENCKLENSTKTSYWSRCSHSFEKPIKNVIRACLKTHILPSSFDYIFSKQHCIHDRGTCRRGFTIGTKRPKPRAPEIVGVKTISSISVSNYISAFLVWFQRTFFHHTAKKNLYRTGQHASKCSKGQIININLPRAAKNIYFISM